MNLVEQSFNESSLFILKTNFFIKAGNKMIPMSNTSETLIL